MNSFEKFTDMMRKKLGPGVVVKDVSMNGVEYFTTDGALTTWQFDFPDKTHIRVEVDLLRIDDLNYLHSILEFVAEQYTLITRTIDEAKTILNTDVPTSDRMIWDITNQRLIRDGRPPFIEWILKKLRGG